MMNSRQSAVESSFRKHYGNLFAALSSQFGARYVSEIEDAIQNSFYKALRSWKPGKVPSDRQSWLFIVARNDLINQLRKASGHQSKAEEVFSRVHDDVAEDLRLLTMLYLSKTAKISARQKVMFILKNIFGLHVKEIGASLLMSEDAIYKAISRVKKSYVQLSNEIEFMAVQQIITPEQVAVVEEILYAVFNIGFDSFNDRIEELVNEDLCLEALALARALYAKCSQESTKNLLALFCFHIARIPAKMVHGKFVSFFDQDRSKWNYDLMGLGLKYLESPKAINKYYLEALITSKHMTASVIDRAHWEGVIDLYQLLLPVSSSPINKLNLCYCLTRAGRTHEASRLLNDIEKDLPIDHVYLSLVKAAMLRDSDAEASESAFRKALANISQDVRRDHILENMCINVDF